MEKYPAYVVARPKKDGRALIRFQVPKRLRPAGWRGTRPILVDGRDGVDLASLTPAQEDQIVRQAEVLYRELHRSKASESQESSQAAPAPEGSISGERSWARLIEIRRASEMFTSRAARTQKNYAKAQHIILDVLGNDPQLGPACVLEDQLEEIFQRQVPNKFARDHVYAELRQLIAKATVQGWRPLELSFRPRPRLPKSEIDLWTEDDVRCMATAALQDNEPGLAKLIIAQWEIGQRLTSARYFRYGYQYADGMFSHTCRKTNRQVRIEVLDPTARKLLDRDFAYGEYMFLSHRTGKPFDELQLSGRFGYIRSKTPGYGNRKLKMRCLRHSAILEFARAHCTIAEIRSVTGHSIRTVHRILDTYMPGHDALASAATARRQHMRVHGQPGELIVENKRRLWLGDLSKAPRALTPEETARGAGR